MSTESDPDPELAAIDKIFENVIKEDVQSYGIGSDLCLRYKRHNPESKKWWPCYWNDELKKLYAYHIAFIYYKRYYPENNISHVCGKQACITESHLRDGVSITENNERSKCHNRIINLLDMTNNKKNRNGTHFIKKGKITVYYANRKYKILDPTLKIKDMHKCTHNPKCFINRPKCS